MLRRGTDRGDWHRGRAVATIDGISLNPTLSGPADPADPPSDAPTPPVRSHRGAIIGIVVVAVLLVGASFVAGLANRSKPKTWQGTLWSPAPAKPDFTLTDTSGHPYDFRARTQGQLTLLFFGYTHCPDVCPITLATIAGALNNLPGHAVTVVFVTTDPARDTTSRLRSWLDGYDTELRRPDRHAVAAGRGPARRRGDGGVSRRAEQGRQLRRRPRRVGPGLHARRLPAPLLSVRDDAGGLAAGHPAHALAVRSWNATT